MSTSTNPLWIRMGVPANALAVLDNETQLVELKGEHGLPQAAFLLARMTNSLAILAGRIDAALRVQIAGGTLVHDISRTPLLAETWKHEGEADLVEGLDLLRQAATKLMNAQGGVATYVHTDQPETIRTVRR